MIFQEIKLKIKEIKEKVDFRQRKYMLPALLYGPVLLTAYFTIGFSSVTTAEIPDQTKEKTTYLNDKLPGAVIKGDGIGGKIDNMRNSYGMIDDATAVNNIERGGEEKKEEYDSKYTEEELAQLQSEAEKQAEATKLAESAGQKDAETSGQSAREKEAIKELEKALAEARLKGQLNVPSLDFSGELSVSGDVDAKNTQKQKSDKDGKVSDEDAERQVVRKVRTSSDYFNTLADNEHEPNMIKAIIDENIKAVDGSRVRLRLLDDVVIGEAVVTKGSYLYATMSGFGGQRVKGNVKSVLVDDEIIKINLSIYDTDGLEGLYVPASSFRETSQDVASGAMSGNMSFNSTSTGNSLRQWGVNAAQNAYQKTTNAISKAIKKNRAKLKYGTFVYLINSKESKTK